MNVLFEDDYTHSSLAIHLQKTEEIVNELLNKFDKNSHFNIHASLDLGFPHDLMRLAGGFATGLLIDWNCKVPFIPVDTTVNVCSGSIYELSENIADKLDESFFLELKAKIENESTYRFNFERGNHFIILARGKNSKKYYLLLHSSASEFKKDYNGLYPVPKNWFYDDIQTFQKNERFIRYITGSKAELFAKIANQTIKYNEVRHDFVAEAIVNKFCKIENSFTIPHYFMPDNQSILIGSYLAKKGQIVPIFSNVGLPIFLYKVDECDANRVNFKGQSNFLIPHGWGKESIKVPNLEINYSEKFLILNDVKETLDIDSSLRSHPDLKLRNFSINQNDENYYFKKVNNKISGEVIEEYHQILSFTKIGLKKWENE